MASITFTSDSDYTSTTANIFFHDLMPKIIEF